MDTHEYGSGFPTAPSASGVPISKLPLTDPDYYAVCGWNLNNLPRLPGSVLRHVDEDVAGINVPWMYYGMLFSTFAWHTEDNDFASINYMHAGAAKTWCPLVALPMPFELSLRCMSLCVCVQVWRAVKQR